MYALLKVFYKGTEETLCFCAEECAEHFKKFLEAHEKLGSKKYGAYKSVSGAEISLCKTMPKEAQINLHNKDIISMAHNIKQSSSSSRVGYSFGIQKDAIFFYFAMRQVA